jgi:hypothetical protein
MVFFKVMILDSATAILTDAGMQIDCIPGGLSTELQYVLSLPQAIVHSLQGVMFIPKVSRTDSQCRSLTCGHRHTKPAHQWRNGPVIIKCRCCREEEAKGILQAVFI